MKLRPSIRFFALSFALSAAAALAAPDAVRQVDADYQRVKGPNRHVEAFCVGAGRVGELLREAAVTQLRDVHDACGFRYVRCHGLFHDELAVYAENAGQPVYNFEHIDLAYDAVLRAGMKPFVELGFMPSALASGTKTIFWWKANVTPPRDYDRWGDLVRAFVTHLEQRYGRDEVRTWFFEVWNEPNLAGFFAGTQDDYFHLYAVSARAIKAVCADYQVGGPATAGNAWVPELIAYCTREHVPLDFISTHHYGTRSVLDEFGKKNHALVQSRDAITGAMEKVREQIKSSLLPALPLYYTEWSTSPSSRDPVHDSYFSAAYILNTVRRGRELTDAMSYWTFTDVFEEAGPAPAPFHGGFGLINLQGLHKPSYFAFKFLHELGAEELECADSAAIVGRDGAGVQVLLWDFSQPEQGNQPDGVFFRRELVPKPVAPAVVNLRALPAGEYRLELYGVGYRRNDVYAAYCDLGQPTNLTRAQERELAASCAGAALRSETVRVGADGGFRYELPLRENDVYLLKLTRR